MTPQFPVDALRPVTRAELRPAYVQIASQLRSVIEAGGVEVGAKLPIESELVERFGVSRMTVREGLRLLKAEGLIRAEHGVGVFVESLHARPVPIQVRGARTSSEPAWREAIIASLSVAGNDGPVGELEEIWASNQIGVDASEITLIEREISDQPGRSEHVRLYVPAPPSTASGVAAEAVQSASSWQISVRTAGPGDLQRAPGDLVVIRTALSDGGRVLLVGKSYRSGAWAVTVTESL